MAELGKDPKRISKPQPPPEAERIQAKDVQLERKKVSAALMQISQRALIVTPRDVDMYAPRELDLRIAEAMLAGAITFVAIGSVLDENPQAIARYMRDPLVCAWVSRTIHSHIHMRLGMIDAAMYERAAAGNVGAAKLLYERYGQMVNKSVTLHVKGGTDFTKFDDSDLDAFIQDANKSAGIIDVPGKERRQDQAADGTGGTEETEA